MVMNMYPRLKAGETINVTAPRTGMQFSIRPERWEGIVLGYSVINLDGKVEKGHNGLILDRETVEDWGLHLEERTNS